MISQKDFETVMAELVQKQGFIVIGFPRGIAGLKVGEVTDRLMQFVMPTEYEAVSAATQDDWNRQNDVIALLRPSWRRFPNGIGGTFLKMRPLRPRLVQAKRSGRSAGPREGTMV